MYQTDQNALYKIAVSIDFSWVLFRLCEHKLSTDSFQNKINVLSCLKVKL